MLQGLKKAAKAVWQKGKTAVAALGVSVGAAVAPATSHATGGLDTTAVLAALTDMQTAIVAVGGAIIVVAAIAVSYKWVKGMLFG